MRKGTIKLQKLPLPAGYAARLAEEGILRLFETAPHAEKLRRIHLESDIPLCAEPDLYPAVPLAAAFPREGVLLRGCANAGG